MNRVVAIARNTVREVMRERIVLMLALFGVALVGASQVLSPLALGEGKKVVTDFGLAGSALLSTLLVVFLGSSLLHKELDRRTIYAVMAKPIRRAEFLLGKFLGLWATACLLLVAMTLMVLALLAVVHGDVSWILLGALLLTLVELAIVTAFVIFFSSFSTPGLTALFTVAVVVAGAFAEQILYFGGQGGGPLLAVLSNFFYWLVPHLEVFNARGLVTHGITVPPERLAFATAYGFLYAGALLTAAGAIFERREFR
jgi:ABC-type transport system involved in multi-copper enzyme maturation permease subunit